MISQIRGKLLSKNPPNIILDVNGIGYEISIPMTNFYNLPQVSEEVSLFTHYVVREDAQLLYGFLTSVETGEAGTASIRNADAALPLCKLGPPDTQVLAPLRLCQSHEHSICHLPCIHCREALA